MNTIYSEKKKKFTVDIHKNYLNIHSVQKSDDYLDLFTEKKIGGNIFKTKFIWVDRSFKDYAKYYKTPKKEIGERKGINIRYHYTTYEVFDNFEKVKKYYADPFSTFSMVYFQRSIREYDDKIIISYVKLSKIRQFNYKFFKKNVNENFISINKKTGNITTKVKGKFRLNSFKHIIKFINELFIWDGELNNDNFIQAIYDSLNKTIPFPNNFSLQKHEEENTNYIEKLSSIILLFFSEKRKIKIPDVNLRFIFLNYPLEKKLKKNDRNILKAILDNHKINDNFSYRLFLKFLKYIDSNKEKTSNFEIANTFNTYERLSKLFGNTFSRYISNINDGILNSILLNSVSTYYAQLHPITLSKKEKSNLIKIINSSAEIFNSETFLNNKIRDFLIILFDHIRMLSKIRLFSEKIEITSTTLKTFYIDHQKVSKLYGRLNQVFYVNEYPQELINIIEESIEYKGNLYYPHLLMNTEEYIAEGEYMHHCVSSYITSNTIIVSIRKNEKERVTNEYSNTGILIQTRAKFNGNPSEDFIYINDLLSNKIKKAVRLDFFKKNIIVDKNKNNIDISKIYAEEIVFN